MWLQNYKYKHSSDEDLILFLILSSQDLLQRACHPSALFYYYLNAIDWKKEKEARTYTHTHTNTHT